MRKSCFTEEELRELKFIDAEIDRNFEISEDEIKIAERRDREAIWDGMDSVAAKRSEYQYEYRKHNKEKIQTIRRAHYERNREAISEAGKKRFREKRYDYHTRMVRAVNQIFHEEKLMLNRGAELLQQRWRATNGNSI